MRRDQRCRGRSGASRVDCHTGNTSRANASCLPPRTRRRQTAGLLVSSCQPDTWTGRTAAVRQWTAAWQHPIQRALERAAPGTGPQHGRWPVRPWQAVRATSMWNSSGTVLHIERPVHQRRPTDKLDHLKAVRSGQSRLNRSRAIHLATQVRESDRAHRYPAQIRSAIAASYLMSGCKVIDPRFGSLLPPSSSSASVVEIPSRGQRHFLSPERLRGP